MTLLRIRDGIIEWPYSRAQLQADQPQLSLSWELPEHELRSLEELGIYVYRAVPTEPPSQDGLQAVEVSPECVNDVWQQSWELQPLPTAAAQPDWTGFAVSLIFDTAIQEWFNGLPQATGNGLNAGLQQASEGRPRLFLALWERLLPDIPVEVLTALHVIAEACNLPADFTAKLAPPVTDQQE